MAKKKESAPGNQPDTSERIRRSSNDYIKYSGMAFQLGATILIFALIGRWLDGRIDAETPWFTIVLSLVGVAGGLYLALKDFVKPKK